MITAIYAITFFLVGVVVYYLDSLVLSKINKTKGLIVGHSLLWRAIAGLVLVILLELKIVHGTGAFEDELAYSLLEWICIVVGFYLARHFLKWAPGKLKAIIQYAKDAEAGNVNPVNDMKEVLSDTVQKGVQKNFVEKVTVNVMPNQQKKVVPDEPKEVVDEKETTKENGDTRTFEEKIHDLKNRNI